MDEKTIHDLAIAYAQVKLLNYHEELKKQLNYNPFMCDSDEIYQYIKAYRFAELNIEQEYDKID